MISKLNSGEPVNSDFALLAYALRRKSLLFMINMIKEISTNEVFQLLGKPETKIIDIRPIDAYNGWCLQNESRCGHIKGAKSLPAKWIEYIDWIEIVRAKKILPQHKIVIYGYSSCILYTSPSPR